MASDLNRYFLWEEYADIAPESEGGTTGQE